MKVTLSVDTNPNVQMVITDPQQRPDMIDDLNFAVTSISAPAQSYVIRQNMALIIREV